MSSAAFVAVSTTTQGVWGSTAGDHEKLKLPLTNLGDMAFVLESYTGGGAGTHKFRTFVTEPLAAGIIFNASTTWTFVMRIGESSASANVYTLFHVSVLSEDGVTTRAEFTANEKDGVEATVSTTTPSSRTNVNTGGIVYTTVANDRIQIEIGWDQDGSGSYTVVASRGNTSGTDLSSTDGDTDIQNPWFECSTTLTLGSAEPPPAATNEDWDATIYLSGVLDEWV